MHALNSFFGVRWKYCAFGIASTFTLRPTLAHMPASAMQIFSSFT